MTCSRITNNLSFGYIWCLILTGSRNDEIHDTTVECCYAWSMCELLGHKWIILFEYCVEYFYGL